MSAFSARERQAVTALTGLFALRMVGLFMILPVFAVLGPGLTGATPLLIGVAVGAYGLAQLLFQIPFGLWADRYDRRHLILLGLLLFIAGGLLAAVSEHIWGVIAGRFLQGAGAISAVVMALLSDAVRDQLRTRAMALLGMSIGLAFALSFVLGPWLSAWLGLPGLFLATAVLGLLALLLALWRVPRVASQRQLPPHYRVHLRRMLAEPELRRLNLGIFTLHLVMMACFVALPTQLVAVGLPVAQHGWLYLPVMLLSFVFLVPAVILAEQRQRMREVFLLAIGLLTASMPVLALAKPAFWPLVLAVGLFFFAFNLLEALLPSLVSKTSPAGGKGTAMGIYSTSQFAGAFAGGVLGGLVLQQGSHTLLFALLTLMLLFWLVRAWSMQPPKHWKSLVIRPQGALQADLLPALEALPGVEELVLLPDDVVIYLKVDPQQWQPELAAALPVRVAAV